MLFKFSAFDLVDIFLVAIILFQIYRLIKVTAAFSISIAGHFGMRHRSAIGVTEHVDALAVVISEETGHISVVDSGVVKENISAHQLRQVLLKEKI